MALCFVSSPDGLPHVAKGMVQPFDVAPAAGDAAAPPQATDTVVMRDFSFELPAAIAAGPQIWEVVNEGPQPHEIALVKLAQGATPEQVMGMLAGPSASPEAEHETGTPEAAAPGQWFSFAVLTFDAPSSHADRVCPVMAPGGSLTPGYATVNEATSPSATCGWPLAGWGTQQRAR